MAAEFSLIYQVNQFWDFRRILLFNVLQAHSKVSFVQSCGSTRCTGWVTLLLQTLEQT